MIAPDGKRRPARLQLLLITALFLGPLLFAAWMYYGGIDLKPAGRSNRGLLLEPIRHLSDRHPMLRELAPGQWLLVYANENPCDDGCRRAIHALRQSRLMLGNDMHRLARVFLRGDNPTDRVLQDEQQKGLKVLQDRGLAQDLGSALPRDTPPGGFFLLDPLGNLVMYFGPDLSPREMIDDIEHLLELSRIG